MGVALVAVFIYVQELNDLLKFNKTDKKAWDKMKSIPRPLVRFNQWIIVLSVLISWISHLDWILLVPFLSGISGLLFQVNPIMKIGKVFLRKSPNQYIPEDFDQQQFNQVIAVICLGVGITSVYLGWSIMYYTATIMVFSAAAIALVGFCIGCFIRYQWLQYKFRRSQQTH